MHRVELEITTRLTPRSPPTPHSSPPFFSTPGYRSCQCTTLMGSAPAPQSRSPEWRQRACHGALETQGRERSDSVRLVRIGGAPSSSGARVASTHTHRMLVVVVGRPHGQSASDALWRTYSSSCVALLTFSCSARMSWTLPEARGALAAVTDALYWPPRAEVRNVGKLDPAANGPADSRTEPGGGAGSVVATARVRCDVQHV